MLNRIIKAGIITLIIAVLLELYLKTYTTAYAYLASEIDSHTKGVIEKSEYHHLGRRGGSWYYDVLYKYEVDGRIYLNDLVSYSKRNENAFEIVKKYPVGKVVTVYYDSANPDFSVLEKNELDRWVYIYSIVLLSLFGLLVFTYYITD